MFVLSKNLKKIFLILKFLYICICKIENNSNNKEIKFRNNNIYEL